MQKILLLILFSFLINASVIYGQDINLPKKLHFYTDAKSVYLVKTSTVRALSSVTASYQATVFKTYKGEVLPEFYIEVANPELETKGFEEQVNRIEENSFYIIIDPNFISTYGNIKVAYGIKNFIPLKSQSFKIDSALFAVFNEQAATTYIDNEYFRGHLLNHKPNGKWIEQADSGEYLLGKKIGHWKVEGKSVYFGGIDSTEAYTIEVYGDTTVTHKGKDKQMESKGAVLRTWTYYPTQKQLIIRKFNGGVLYEKAIFDRELNLKKVFSYENGKKQKKALLEGMPIGLVEYFYYRN